MGQVRRIQGRRRAATSSTAPCRITAGKRLLDEKPLKFDLEALKEPPTPLRFPGKILADEKGNRLFISDSNHNRIVVADARRQAASKRSAAARSARATAIFKRPRSIIRRAAP